VERIDKIWWVMNFLNTTTLINSEIASLTKSLNLKVEDLLGITKFSGKSKKGIL